jgi:hypothetical protein
MLFHGIENGAVPLWCTQLSFDGKYKIPHSHLTGVRSLAERIGKVLVDFNVSKPPRKNTDRREQVYNKSLVG